MAQPVDYCVLLLHFNTIVFFKRLNDIFLRDHNRLLHDAFIFKKLYFLAFVDFSLIICSIELYTFIYQARIWEFDPWSRETYMYVVKTGDIFTALRF